MPAPTQHLDTRELTCQIEMLANAQKCSCLHANDQILSKTKCSRNASQCDVCMMYGEVCGVMHRSVCCVVATDSHTQVHLFYLRSILVGFGGS